LKAKVFLMIFWLIYIAGDVSAQISFVKVFPFNGYYSEIFSSRQTKDNGYILTGWGYISMSTKIFQLIKTDSLGQTVSGGGGYAIETFGMSAIPTSDNGYLFLINNGSFTNQYYGFIKTDSMCNEIWNKFYNTSYLGFVSQTTDSGYIAILAGSGVLFRTNPVGDIAWSKTYGGILSSVQQTNDSGFIAVGTTSIPGSGNEIYVLKTDYNGDTLWTKAYGGTGSDMGMDIKQTPDSGYIITGSTTSFGPDSVNVYLIKTDVNGNVTWSKTYGSGGYWSNKIELIQNGGYNVYCGDVVIKTDALGDTLKIIKSIGDIIQQTSDGGYLLNYYYAGIVKTDSNGGSCYGNSFPPVFTIGNPATQTTQPIATISNLAITSFSASIYTGGFGASDSTICTTVGIPQISNFEFPISISPNPFNTSTTLTIPDHLFNDHLTLSIFNVDGRILRKQNITSHQTIIERNCLAAGIYIYKLTNKKIVKTIGKFVIQ
jgi:hypothetical protein